MLTIDGVRYDVKCEIKRTADISASDISGLLLDKSYFNDVMGTYMTFELTLKYPLYDQDKYAALYEALTEPVDGHSFILPYNQDEIEITARVEPVSDDLFEMESGRTFWRGLSFAIIANHPTKAMSLDEVITRGRAPLPHVAEPAEGDTYTYHNGAWGPVASYEDADDKVY